MDRDTPLGIFGGGRLLAVAVLKSSVWASWLHGGQTSARAELPVMRLSRRVSPKNLRASIGKPALAACQLANGIAGTRYSAPRRLPGSRAGSRRRPKAL